jgi:flagellar motor protein MotB
MAREKCPPCPPKGAPDWMVTYGDLMTLLLCFFVLLFSFSELDKVEFRSLKDTFTGAFGVMQGHSVMEGLGVTSQPQRYTSMLFDEAIAKVRKAQSDRYPHEQIIYLNAALKSAVEAVGVLAIEAAEKGISVDQLQNLMKTVSEKLKDTDKKRSRELIQREMSETEDAKQLESTAEPSKSIKDIKMLKEKISPKPAQEELNKDKKAKNLEEKAPDQRVLARGNRFTKERGDASRNQKTPGRNKPLIGNPGDNELQEGLTGQGLRHQQRMDRVEGKKEKKRFDFQVPRKETADRDFLNISGQVKNTQADANRAVVALEEPLAAALFFYPKSHRLKPEASLILARFIQIFRENRGGYFQVESHTDASVPGPEYSSNMDLSLKMSIALILKFIEMEPAFSPSRFAALGWSDHHPIGAMIESAKVDFNQRIEIHWVKRGQK